MSPGIERGLLIAANVSAIGGGVASVVGALPDYFLPPAVLLFGGATLYLLRRYVTHAALARRIMLSSTLVLTLLMAYGVSNWVWPHRFPLGQVTAKDAQEGAQGSAAGAAHASLARGLKVTEPTQREPIGTCTAVVGTGRIPAGFQVWVANLNDQGGKPATSALYNLRQATPPLEGEADWTTGAFGVGGASDGGKTFWIYVYLLPNSAGSIIENIIMPAKDPGWRPSLKAPIAGLKPFDKIFVQRTSEDTCDGH
jgi:hypothetical protein